MSETHEEREIFEYIQGRCERLGKHGIHIKTPAAGEFTVTVLNKAFKTRIAALNRAEEIARLLGFEK